MRSLLPATHVAAFTSFARATSKATKKATLLLFSVAMLLAGAAAAARGQSALDGFDPNANGVVNVIVVQPDGKILIGGDFTTLSPNGGVAVARNRIARLNPDGTLDTLFNPNANGSVRTMVVQVDGKVLVGGDFNGASSIGGQARNRIARLDATIGAADSFDPNANGTVRTIAVQVDGKILVGGNFTGASSIGGQTRNHIARLDATTGAADSFDPNANQAVLTIAVQADGKVLAGGGFNGPINTIGGQMRNYIARLDATTGAADSFNPNAFSSVRTIVVQIDGKILVGGDFNGPNSMGGQTRNRIARLDPVSALADSFDPNANSNVLSLAVQADGKILAVGNFFGANSIGGQTRNQIARLDAMTGVADSFDPNGTGTVISIAVQADGGILAGGNFTTIGGKPRNRIARLETDGRLDQTLNLNNLSTVGANLLATAVQPDGKILIGGAFTSVLGVPRNNIARFNTDGTVDATFDPNANDSVFAIAVQADGKILVGGFFLGPNSIGGQTRNRIARLDPTTGLADSFDANANNAVRTIAVQADGQVLVGGDFFGVGSIGGQARNFIARLDTNTGSADPSFDPNANGIVYSITVQSDGKILAGGHFISIGGQPRNSVARLNPNSGLADLSFASNINNDVYAIAVQTDGNILVAGLFTAVFGQPRNFIARLDATTGFADSFNPNANDVVSSIALQADGGIIAGGSFTNIGGQPRNRIARLDATAGLADSFDPNANNTVKSTTLLAGGKILAGGSFTTIGSQPKRNLFARLSNATPALQNLGVVQNAITWTLGGSSPQFTRVTFEYSTDNISYTPLGNGTASGSDWTKSGLSFSTGQNIYIRARGYYRSGFNNGSESVTESVRNAFLAGPTAADATISGQVTTPDGGSLGGVLVTLSGAKSAWALTDGNGTYRFDSVDTGNFYTITPGLANYSFSPSNRSFSLLGSKTDAVFTAVHDTAPVGNAIDTSEFFVRQQYLDFLGRELDQGGLEYWNNEIARCGNDTACVNKRRIDVSAAFFMAKEFQETGSFVYGLYKASFGNQPSYQQFTTDRAKVVGGTDLDARKNALAAEWVQRDSFRQAYPNSMTSEQAVNKLFESAGLVPHTGEWETYVLTLNNGGTRAQVLRSLTESHVFTAKEYNATFVLMEYFAYLRRDPDPGGYAFWLDVLNYRDPGNFRSIVCAFITSTEYQKRFSSMVTYSNAECGR